MGSKARASAAETMSSPLRKEPAMTATRSSLRLRNLWERKPPLRRMDK